MKSCRERGEDNLAPQRHFEEREGARERERQRQRDRERERVSKGSLV